MSVKNVCVYRFLVVFNGVAFLESFNEIAREKLVGYGPVSFAVLNSLHVTVIRVRKVVEAYVYTLVRTMAAELDYRQREPLLACDYLQAGNATVVDVISLCRYVFNEN